MVVCRESGPDERFNLSELLNHLEIQLNRHNHSILPINDEKYRSFRIQQINLLKKWFNEHHYTMSLPFYNFYQRAKYSYEVKVGNIKEAALIQTKLLAEQVPFFGTRNFVSNP